jgi:phosphate transport system substrate-binding protein
MRAKRVWGSLAFGVAALVALGGCGQSGGPKPGGAGGVFTVVVDGSSTVYPISEAAGEAFQKDKGGQIRVTVAESGTGGGFKKFCRGESQVQGASRPILAEEMAACKKAGIDYVELPIAFDALSVVVHPDNPLQSITVEELKKIWAPDAQGVITTWRQVNPNFPDLPLALYGAGTASGTFDYFTEAVVGKAKSSRNDYTPSEDDNVLVQGISSDKGALGYFGMAYYTENKTRVRALGISYKGGAPVLPSAETVASGAYQPLSRPIFIYVNAAALGRRPVMEFVTAYLTRAPEFAESVGCVALPASAYETGLKRIKSREIGTAFGGKQDIGDTIDNVLARPLSTQAPKP